MSILAPPGSFVFRDIKNDVLCEGMVSWGFFNPLFYFFSLQELSGISSTSELCINISQFWSFYRLFPWDMRFVRISGGFWTGMVLCSYPGDFCIVLDGAACIPLRDGVFVFQNLGEV